MSTSAGGDQRKFHPHQLFLSKKLRQVDIPPRKLLSRRSPTLDMPIDFPRHEEETLLQKYLPYNNPHDDEEEDPYSADQFRMYEFKVRRCTRSRSHDWTDCPFVHPGEKARRRDPRKYHYSGVVCQEYRHRGECTRGDNCEFSHGVFESWLHPARYRTEACKDGRSCQRKICFFAHTPKQLRILPFRSNDLVNSSSEGHQCCSHCPCLVVSPNSTLMSMSDMSPPALMSMSDMSPPLSPSIAPGKLPQHMGGFSPNISRGRMALAELAELKRRYGPGYKKELIKLMNSIQAMDMNKNNLAKGSGTNKNRSWVDVFDLRDDNQQPFFMSPSAPSSSGSGQAPSDPSSSRSGQFASRNHGNFDFTDENGATGAPDLGWVNELLISD